MAYVFAGAGEHLLARFFFNRAARLWRIPLPDLRQQTSVAGV